MELTGKAVGASLDFDTKHFRITFEVNENDVVKNEYDKLKGYEKLKIKAVRYTQRRSLDANAYFHVLVGKIADVLTISKAKAKGSPSCYRMEKLWYTKRMLPKHLCGSRKQSIVFLLSMRKKPHFIRCIAGAIHMTQKKCRF